MAKVRQAQVNEPIAIERFLGINEDTSGSTSIQLGEASESLNYRITENYKLRKRQGYNKLFDSISANPVRAMWYGELNNTETFLFVQGGNVYELDLTDNSYSSVGTLTDDVTSIFYFNDKVYFLNGNEYKSYDGTTFGTVTGYRPIILTATLPAGGGTILEPVNLLNGLRTQQFNGDGSSTVYQ